MTVATPVRYSPVHTATTQAGARYTRMAGWQVPEMYTDLAAELAAARERAGLVDLSSFGKLYVEGAAAAEALQAAFGQAPAAVGASAPVPGGAAYRLRPDLCLLITQPGAEADLPAQIEKASAGFVTVTDVTHGLAGFGLVGPQARTVLSHLSGLDFGDAAFPNRAVRPTSLAKTRQIITRHDRGGQPAFGLFGPQSFAAYVWDALLEAGHPAGLVPLGLAAFKALEG